MLFEDRICGTWIYIYTLPSHEYLVNSRTFIDGGKLTASTRHVGPSGRSAQQTVLYFFPTAPALSTANTTMMIMTTMIMLMMMTIKVEETIAAVEYRAVSDSL
jgi:hypothetical protein